MHSELQLTMAPKSIVERFGFHLREVILIVLARSGIEHVVDRHGKLSKDWEIIRTSLERVKIRVVEFRSTSCYTTKHFVSMKQQHYFHLTHSDWESRKQRISTHNFDRISNNTTLFLEKGKNIHRVIARFGLFCAARILYTKVFVRRRQDEVKDLQRQSHQLNVCDRSSLIMLCETELNIASSLSSNHHTDLYVNLVIFGTVKYINEPNLVELAINFHFVFSPFCSFVFCWRIVEIIQHRIYCTTKIVFTSSNRTKNGYARN